MADFQIKRLPYNLTAYAGLSLVGQYLKRYAQIDQIIDPQFPVSGRGAIATSSLIKAYVGLLCMGKSDFDAIEALRPDAFFKSALGLAGVPSSPTLRQRLDALGETHDSALSALDEANARLLRRARPSLTPLASGHLAVDFDVFTLDNSGTSKEGVGRTYMGLDGYAPIAGYVGEEGYCLGLELRPGTQHSACDTPDFLKRLLPRARTLSSRPLLVRADAGFDGAAIFAAMAAARAAGPLDWVVKWNPRGFDTAELHQRLAADGATDWVSVREGKRETFVSESITRTHGGVCVSMRRLVHVVERTIDRKGQRLLVPQIEVEGWLTSLDWAPERIVKCYQGHGTHEQYHSEFKTDLDLERLPEVLFATNDLVLAQAVLAFNILRAIGFMDVNGWFYVVDRKKDMINAAGYKVWPREVEDVLYAHPAVREVAVVGVMDTYRGETVKAVISLREGQQARREDIVTWCRERLAAYKMPREVSFVEDLPKSATGKILRRMLRGEPADSALRP